MLRDKAPISLAPVLPSVSMYKTMATILQKDGSVALGQVKCMLEYMLWGPSDIIFEVGIFLILSYHPTCFLIFNRHNSQKVKIIDLCKRNKGVMFCRFYIL